jgi:hypothetical protein
VLRGQFKSLGNSATRQVPLSGQESIKAEDHERIDGQGHSLTGAATVDHLPQCRAAPRNPVEVERGEGDADDPPRVRLVLKTHDRDVHEIELSSGRSDWVGEAHLEKLQFLSCTPGQMS